jgi:hypothetical protein
MLDMTDHNVEITLEIILRKKVNGWALVNKCRSTGMLDITDQNA